MRHFLRLTGVSLAVAVIGLQAWPEAQDRRQMQMAADLRMLQEQTQQLQTLLQAVDVQLETRHTVF